MAGEQYIYNDLGQRSAGDVVRFVLSGNSANVMLLDSSNYSSYRNGRQFRYVGGHATRSPVDLQVPHSGHWYGVVDMRGLAGRVNAKISVLPSALPPLRQVQRAPLPTVVDDMIAAMPAGDATPTKAKWDVFISHATEDKDAVVRPLANALQTLGVHVWYDEFELRIGDSLRRKIDSGLANSRFGVVVLSEAFFAKNWPQYELDGLVTREIEGGRIILPLWHRITKAEVLARSPSLADKLARSTSDMTVEEIAEEIKQVVLDV